MSRILISKASKYQINLEDLLNCTDLEKQIPQLNSTLSDFQLAISEMKHFKEMDYEKACILKEKIKCLESSYQDFKKRVTAAKSIVVAKNRQELLQMSYQASKPEADESSILFAQTSRLDTAAINVDRYIEIGRNSLSELYMQRDIMKNTQKKLLDIGNRLGLSKSVMKFIDQRTKSDNYILGAGLVVTITLMYFIVKYFG